MSIHFHGIGSCCAYIIRVAVFIMESRHLAYNAVWYSVLYKARMCYMYYMVYEYAKNVAGFLYHESRVPEAKEKRERRGRRRGHSIIIFTISNSFFPSSSSSNPRSRSGAFFPLPTTYGTCLHFYREKNSALSSLVDARRIVRARACCYSR